MATYSKNEMAEVLTESTMALYQDFNGIISLVTENKLCSNPQDTTSLNLTNLSALLDLHFKSLSVLDILTACTNLNIDATYNSKTSEFSVVRKRMSYLTGVEIGTTNVGELEMATIKSEDGLVFCIEASYLEQGVDAIVSPYNNGLIFLTDKESN
ncbi:hypothetical protein [Photobacterium damselae]|uniref:hypothetical protein n=1 Tax=Photobacterium damselae TaxID=38293 RepID=UPI004067A63E